MKKVYCALCCILALSASQAGNVSVGDAMHADLREQSDYLEDPASRLDAEMLLGNDSAFSHQSRIPANSGFSHSTHWLRVILTNPGPHATSRWLEVGNVELEQVVLFERDSNTGQAIGAAPTLHSSAAVFALTLAPKESRELLLRVRSRSAIRVSLSLWSPYAYLDIAIRYVAINCLTIGVTLILALASLNHFRRGRYRFQLHLGITLLSMDAFLLYKFGLLRIIWPDSVAMHANLAHWAVLPFAVSSLIFIHEGLQLRLRAPRLHAALAALGVVFCIILGATQFISMEASTITQLAGVALSVAGHGAACAWLHRKGHRMEYALVCGLLLYYPLLALPYLLDLGAEIPSAIGQWSYMLCVLKLLAVILLSNNGMKKQTQQEGEERHRTAQSELQRQTSDLQDAANRANAANWAKSELFARVSHELRAPLHLILGYAHLVGSGARRITSGEATVAITSAARRQLGLIDQLLEFSRADAGRLRLSPESTAWEQFIRQMSEEAQQMCVNDNRTVLHLNGPQPGLILLDRHRLRQVIDNLLNNAQRHTRHGVITIDIAATLGADSVQLHFSISDTGSGIDADKQKHLFEPFLEGAMGTGLGLAISAQLVELLGGKLRLRHTCATGSCFAFDIRCPFLESNDSPPPPLPPCGYVGAVRSILIIDDDADNRRVLMLSLQEKGFSVKAAGSGHRALDQFDDHVDLVITEQRLRDGDGWSILRQVRQNNHACPVILLSGSVPQRPPHASGADDFSVVIQKPAEFEVLQQHIGTLLGLQWIRPPAAAAPQRSGANMPPLPAMRLASVATMAEQGMLTDVIDWLEEFREACTAPHEVQFADDIADAARLLDFDKITQLVARA